MKRDMNVDSWLEYVWQRPYNIEAVQEMLSHLAAHTPRGPVVFEARGSGGQMRYLIGADSRYMLKITEAIKAHGNISFYDCPDDIRSPVRIARQLVITKPTLSLNTDTTMPVIRAGLAAMAAAGGDEETVLQVVLGGAYSPRSLPPSMPDPHATLLDVVLGNAIEASPESRKSAKEKAAQYGFDAVIRFGSTTDNAAAPMSSIHSALRTVEAAGVRINSEACNPAHINEAHVPWRFPSRLSVMELANFLMLPVGEEELEGANRLHPKPLLPPKWYQNPTGDKNDRTFALSMNMANRQRLSISPQDSLEHTHILGPTGSGKSTAMLNIIMASIEAGHSNLVIDPKNELVTNILERTPDGRADDLIIIDPSDPCPVGFNPFAFKEYKNPELIADAVLATMRQIFSENWGITTQDVLSGALHYAKRAPRWALSVVLAD